MVWYGFVLHTVASLQQIAATMSHDEDEILQSILHLHTQQTQQVKKI